MKKLELEGLSLDDLWALHEQIGKLLSSRIIAEKQQLEKRLDQLNRGKSIGGSNVLEPKANEAKMRRPRRNYPKDFPKYQNPAVPSETWSGRGKQPRWLVLALQSGRTIEDFEIPNSQMR
jgi:DNA-binding protein H-NS